MVRDAITDGVRRDVQEREIPHGSAKQIGDLPKIETVGIVPSSHENGGRTLLKTQEKIWLPFVDMYRTFCLAPGPEAKQLLLGVQQLTHLVTPRHSAGTNSIGSLGGEPR